MSAQWKAGDLVVIEHAGYKITKRVTFVRDNADGSTSYTMVDPGVVTRDELLAKLRQISLDNRHDPEAAHSQADRAIVDYIGDPVIAAAHALTAQWCA